MLLFGYLGGIHDTRTVVPLTIAVTFRGSPGSKHEKQNTASDGRYFKLGQHTTYGVHVLI